MKMHTNPIKTNLPILFEQETMSLLLRVAKRLYYEKQIEKLKSNVKATWKVLNEILNKIKVSVVYHPYLGQILMKFLIQKK